MADLADVPRKFVADARAAAVTVPVDPRATGYEGPNLVAEDTGTVEIKLDGYPVSISATAASVRQVVGTAYLLGGFELIVALDWEVRERVRIETLTLSQLRAAVRVIPDQARAHPREKAAYDRALTEQLAEIPPTERRLQTASDVLRLLHDAWTRIASAEEQVLRDYEPRLIAQFANLAKDARTLALQEWARYEPYDVSASDVLPLTTSEAKERSSDDLRLRREAAELVKAIWDLYDSWKDYLDSLASTRRLIGLGARRIRLANSGSDPEEQIANSRANNAAKFKAFDERRSEIGAKFPAALQVYGKLATLSTSKLTTTDAAVEGLVIEALIEAVESAQDLAYEALTHPLFKAGTRMRVEVGDGGSAVSNLPGYQQDRLARGLTIPASRIIANQLLDIEDAAKSPWLQLPARLALFKRGTEGEARLAPYFAPGRLHHGALSEVNNALQEVRRKQKETVDQALLIIDAIAVPAGFFTGGATMAIAGAIHAVVRGQEMYLTVREYQARDALAQIALVPLQQAIWEHPSAVTLTGKLIEGGFEIATDLVNGGVAGAIMDAIQVSLTIGYGVQAVAEWVAADDPLGDES
jgi:hypothetical protein